MRRIIYSKAKERFNFRQALRIYQSNPARFVRFSHHPNYNIGAGDYSVEMWWYSIANSAANLVSKRSSLFAGWWVQKVEGASTMAWRINNTIIDFATPAIIANGWNHVVFTRDGVANGSNNLNIADYKVIVNGVFYNNGVYRNDGQSVPLNNANVDSTGNLNIGAIDSTVNDDSIIDEAVIYNTPYSLAYAAIRYNLQKGNPIPSDYHPFVIFYTDFDKKSGKAITDKAHLYNNSLSATPDGSLMNYSDAETASNGQPQSGNTAWVDHYTLQPITTN